MFDPTYTAGWLLGFLTLAVGVCTFLLREPAPVPGFCRKCGYNLTGNVSGRCPECGREVPDRGPAVTGSRLPQQE